MTPLVSVVMPAYHEGEAIVPVLEHLVGSVHLSCEVLVVVDFADDPTLAVVEEVSRRHPLVRGVVSSYGRGPAAAIRFGVDEAVGDVVVVTMADGCDDPLQVDAMARMVEQGAVVVAASRYSAGGRQLGGSPLKTALSRLAGWSLAVLAGVGTHDATNSYKAYSAAFLREVGIESRHGFEIGLELTAKAHRRALIVAEVPTTWLDRTVGASNFRLWRWLPHYLRWYLHAFGPPLAAAQTPLSPTPRAGLGLRKQAWS